jgi:putative transposase
MHGGGSRRRHCSDFWPLPRLFISVRISILLPFLSRGVPAHIMSDNGPEFIAAAVQAWITAVDAQRAYITSGSSWENGYIESFNARLRDEFLNGEFFLHAAGGQSPDRSCHYNTIRPHSSLGYRPPAPEVLLWPALPAASKSTLPATAEPTSSIGYLPGRSTAFQIVLILRR